jgi:hypothetical protein
VKSLGFQYFFIITLLPAELGKIFEEGMNYFWEKYGGLNEHLTPQK